MIYKDRQGLIYVIQGGIDGPIKIGFTTRNIEGRLNALQNASPVPLILLGVIPGNWFAEQRIHLELGRHRLWGEWFDFDGVVQHVKSLLDESTTGIAA